MKRLYIFNHHLPGWNHPWNSTQFDWFKDHGFNVHEIRTNAVDGKNDELGKTLDGGIVLCNWADTLLIGLSMLRERFDFKLITYWRSYEFASNFPNFVLWDQVDAVITINSYKHEILKKFGPDKFKGLKPEKIHYIRNPFDVTKYPFKKRQHGYRLGQSAVMSIKKGAALLTEFVQQLITHSPRYRVRIVGGFGEMRSTNHIRYLYLKEEKLREPYFQFFGYAEKEQAIKFLDTLNFVFCVSVDEGDPNFIKEAMAMGIKPIIRTFPGAYEMFPPELITNSIPGMIEMIEKSRKDYNSGYYRKWVEQTSNPNILLAKLQEVIENLL